MEVNSLAKNVENIMGELLEIYVNFVILRNGEIMIIPEFGENGLHFGFIVFIYSVAYIFLELYKLSANLLLVMNITYLSSFH